MGQEVRDKALYRAAIVKGNSKGLRRDMFYLLRHDAGYLVDATASVRNAIGNSEESKAAWVLGLIQDAAEQGHPADEAATWERAKRSLPPQAPKITKADFNAILAHLFQASAVEECPVDHKEKRLRKALVPAGSPFPGPGPHNLPMGVYKSRLSNLIFDPVSAGLIYAN